MRLITLTVILMSQTQIPERSMPCPITENYFMTWFFLKLSVIIKNYVIYIYPFSVLANILFWLQLQINRGWFQNWFHRPQIWSPWHWRFVTGLKQRDWSTDWGSRQWLVGAVMVIEGSQEWENQFMLGITGPQSPWGPMQAHFMLKLLLHKSLHHRAGV